MKKRFISILLVFLLAIGMTMSVYADDVPYIIDDCDVLEDTEEYELSMLADVVADTYGVQIVYICTDDLGGMDNESYVAQICGNYSSDCIILLDNQAEGTIYIEAFGSVLNVIDNDDCITMLDAYNGPATFYEGVQLYYEEAMEIILMAGYYVTETQAQETEATVETQAPETEAVVETAVETEILITDPAVIPEERQLPRLVDEADILTDAEEADILAKLDEISERQEFDVVIATVESFTQDEVKFAAYDYYDYNGFGYGEDNSGVLLFMSMSNRKMNISGTGYGIEAFTDFGREKIIEQIKPELGEDQYYDAFMEFASLADDYITQAKSGDPYDVHNLKEETDKTAVAGIMLLVFELISLIIAKVTTEAEAGKLKSVKYATNAQEYLRQGSLNITERFDTFMYSDIRRVYNPKDRDEGGSTIDVGSSGVEHSSSSDDF